MKPLLAGFVLTAALAFNSAEAQIQRTPYLVIGAGLASCGTWTVARRDRAAVAYEQWILGFISGVAATSYRLPPLFEVDADAIEIWMDNYCRDHPPDQITATGTAFVTAHPR